MNIKEFDYKQFFLQRGEWVGLGIVVPIALLLLYFGFKDVFTADSPSANAESINKLTEGIKNQLKTNQAPADASKPPPEVALKVNSDPVDAEAFHTSIPFFIPSSIEDTKRHNPDIKSPSDFHVDVVRGGWKGYDFQKGPNGNYQIQVITEGVPYAVEKKKGKKTRRVTQGELRQFANSVAPGMAAGGGAGGGKGGGGAGGGGPGGFGPGGMPGMPGMSGIMGNRGGGMGPGMRLGGPKEGFERLIWKDLDKVDESKDALGQLMVPIRMVVVSGTFPYREQMQEFRKALRKRSLNDLLSLLNDPKEKDEEDPWRFKGFEIRRRATTPNGRKGDWEDHYEKKIELMMKYIAARTDSFEDEDPELAVWRGTIVNNGLVMRRPLLARGQYPKTDLEQLKPSIDSLQEFYKPKEGEKPRTLIEEKFKGSGLDIYNPFNPEGNESPEPAKDKEDKPAAAEGTDKKPAENADDPLVPEKALVRFIDPLVEPGYTYEYEIKVRMNNPNFHKKNLAYTSLGEPEELVSAEWTPVPKVEVPYDTYWYAIDKRASKELTNVQIQHWLGNYFLPESSQESHVADWAILEKTPLYRGEYVGRTAPVEVTAWKMIKQDDEIVVNTKTKEKKIPVDFTVRKGNKQHPTLAIDFEGGEGLKTSYQGKSVTDNTPVQVMVLTPEGKLIVQNSEEDTSNAEREQRLKEYKKRIEDAKKTRRTGPVRPGEPSLFDRSGPGGTGPLPR
jgi:hypothetical protein